MTTCLDISLSSLPPTLDGRRVTTVDEAAVLAEGEREARALVAHGSLAKHIHSPGWGRLRLEFASPTEFPD